MIITNEILQSLTVDEMGCLLKVIGVTPIISSVIKFDTIMDISTSTPDIRILSQSDSGRWLWVSTISWDGHTGYELFYTELLSILRERKLKELFSHPE